MITIVLVSHQPAVRAILYWVGAAKLKRDQRRRALTVSLVMGALLLMLFISNVFGL